MTLLLVVVFLRKVYKFEVFRLEISSFGSSSKKTVIIPKQKADEIKALELSLKKQLGKDKTLNIAALTNLLKVLIEK